jgi:hypothetical protein
LQNDGTNDAAQQTALEMHRVGGETDFSKWRVTIRRQTGSADIPPGPCGRSGWGAAQNRYRPQGCSLINAAPMLVGTGAWTAQWLLRQM